MTRGRWKKVEAVFEQALELATDKRTAFLQQSCGGDQELRAEVESLLKAHANAGSFIDDRSSFCDTFDESNTNPPLSIGPYRIVHELGRGGMGVTYRATDEVLQRAVALKVIHMPAAAGDSQAVRERFLREARAAAALKHPNVAGIFHFEASPEADRCYYAMELVDGETLEALVRREGPLKVEEALEIAIQVTRALMAAAAHGLIHRDLKPANIMLTPSESAPGGLEAKVIDFGLAKSTAEAAGERDLTQGGFVGTPAFTSPEQFAGQAADARSDIYSLGVTLWYALTGEVPYGGKTLEEIRNSKNKATFPLEQLVARKMPAPVIKLLRHALASDPSERPQSARALSAELELCRRAMAPRPGLQRAVLGLGFLVIFALGLASFLIHRYGAAVLSPEKSIAVLPFENLSNDEANAFFVAGIQDEILTRLSKIADLKVISRTSTQQYESAPENLPEIARQLGVAHVLEGSVQKNGETVRVNVQLIKAANDSHLWADTYDRKLTNIFSVETEVAKAIADQLRAKLSGREEQVVAAKPTDNPEAYEAYLRGLAYSLKTANTPANALGAQKYLKEAVRLDPKFALCWALLSDVDARGYRTLNLQPTTALREEARQAAETALTLQPNLGEALMANGFYHYACRKEYDIALHYFEQARQFLPNSSRLPESMAYVARRRGQWDRSESYFNEAERLDPRNVSLLTQHALLYKDSRRFPEALRKYDQVLDITPDDVDTLAQEAAVAQAEGNLARASALLAPLHPNADDTNALETQVYQGILERRPAQIIPRLKEILAKPDPALGYTYGQLRFWLGWAQELAGDHPAAQESWRHARSDLETYLKTQPENHLVIADLALINMGLGDKTAAFALIEQARAAIPIEKDAVDGPSRIEILARVAAQMGEPERAISALQKLLSIPYEAALASAPLTPAMLRLDPMFDPLRNDPRFQKLCRLNMQ
jgi:serine/threonine protein kinase/Tfp pilus assembly protein PilF